ncbi:MAG TPA: extracellular solute-binding protein [Streptosporangiaceae bacterium]|nr:extracellular solute-binding protein [Streptosporangiaceae bacterium]
MAHDDVPAPHPSSSEPLRLNRRGFLAGAAALGAGLVTSACGGTYNVGSGITGSSGGDNNSTLVYWNLLTGGDGTHMVSMEDAYRKAYPHVDLQSTILQWGAPYYTKLSLAIRSGSPPDVAIMHLSRIHQYGPPGLLTPISLDLLAQHGMEPKDFTPLAFSKAHYNGQLLCIPLDTHPFVQYYNTKLCKKAGLLDSGGQLPPIKSADAMLAVLRKLKKAGATAPVVCDTINDPATPWRLFYSLYSQAGGEVLADNGKDIVLNDALATRVLTFIHQLASEGLMNANVDPGGGTAVFQAGDAGLYWEGEWNVTVFQAAKMAFSMQPFPALFGKAAAQADSHTFVLPKRTTADPEKTALALTMIRTLLGQSLTWAEGGHIPAWLPVQKSAAYKKLKPQSNYQQVASYAVYDPPAWYSASGSDMENYLGEPLGELMLGGLSPQATLASMKGSLHTLSKEPVPV